MLLGATIIVKNEAKYIEEWLLFHWLQGVDKFFIYDNGSTDNVDVILDKYPSIDTTYIYFPGTARQLAAYKHSIDNFKDAVDWMLFIDIDEFVYSTVSSIKEEIATIQASNIGNILVPWTLYGSNDLDLYEDELVISRFTKRAYASIFIHKSIVNMQKVQTTGKDPHRFRTKGNIVAAPYTLKINHYHTKSKEEYKLKCEKGRADTGTKRDFASNFHGHDTNEIEDSYLKDKFANKIKELMHGR